MKSMSAVLLLVVLAIATLRGVSADVPKPVQGGMAEVARTPTLRFPPNRPTPRANPRSDGVLYWPNDKSTPVIVFASSVVRVPNDPRELSEWVSAGKACRVGAGSEYRYAPWVNNPGHVKTYYETLYPVSVEIASGGCRGFRGWVLNPAALHPYRAGIGG